MKMIIVFPLLLIWLSGQRSYASADAVWLSKIVSQNVTQINRLANIFNVSKESLKELNDMNKQITFRRYQILRIKAIIESTRELNNLNPQGIDGFITKLERGKHLGKEYESLIGDLTPQEKEDLLKKIDEADKKAKSVSEEIKELKLERALTRADVNKTVSENEVVFKHEIEPLVDESREDSEVGYLGVREASVLTARNTSLSNKIAIENNKIGSKNLEVLQDINESLKRSEERHLKEKEIEETFWGVKNKK